jgi:hypothetical protein
MISWSVRSLRSPLGCDEILFFVREIGFDDLLVALRNNLMKRFNAPESGHQEGGADRTYS